MLTRPTAPVLRVALQNDTFLRIEGSDPIGTSPDSVAVGLRPTVTPIAINLVRTQSGALTTVPPTGEAMAASNIGCGLPKSKTNVARVRGGNARRVVDESPEHRRWGKPQCQETFERRARGLGVEWRAILERHIWAQEKRPDALVGVGRPRLRQYGIDRVSRAGLDLDEPLEKTSERNLGTGVVG